MADGVINESSQDTWKNNLYGLPCGLFFYFLNDTIMIGDSSASEFIGNCFTIQSVQYVPFINSTDLNLTKVKYDNSRCGGENGELPNYFNVYRIDEMVNPIKELGTFTPYKVEKQNKIDWRNESRLYNYPYMFAYLTDNLNPPMEIKYHNCKEGTNTIKVKNTVSDRCSYGIFIDGYKGDIDGRMEALVSGDAHELPCSSNQYNQWYATNKNNMTQNIKNMQASTMLQNQGVSMQKTKTQWDSGLSMVGGAIDLFGGGGGDTIATSAVNLYYADKEAALQTQMNNQNVQNSINMALASSNDMKSVPNTMLSMGSDVFYGLVNGNKTVTLTRMRCNDDVMERLGNYFHRFGYKQNRMLDLSDVLRSRYYFNYIKTIGCQITGNIPRRHLESLNAIFDKGVTVWHIDRDGVEPLNFDKADNHEI